MTQYSSTIAYLYAREAFPQLSGHVVQPPASNAVPPDSVLYTLLDSDSNLFLIMWDFHTCLLSRCVTVWEDSGTYEDSMDHCNVLNTAYTRMLRQYLVYLFASFVRAETWRV
jgi:hypothetical protein